MKKMVINIIIMLWGFISGVLCGVLLHGYFKSPTVIEHIDNDIPIDKSKTSDKWIPIYDTLPPNTKDVLVAWKWKTGYWRSFSIAKCLWAPDGKRTWMVESQYVPPKLYDQEKEIEVLAWKPIEPFY